MSRYLRRVTTDTASDSAATTSDAMLAQNACLPLLADDSMNSLNILTSSARKSFCERRTASIESSLARSSRDLAPDVADPAVTGRDSSGDGLDRASSVRFWTASICSMASYRRFRAILALSLSTISLLLSLASVPDNRVLALAGFCVGFVAAGAAALNVLDFGGDAR